MTTQRPYQKKSEDVAKDIATCLAAELKPEKSDLNTFVNAFIGDIAPHIELALTQSHSDWQRDARGQIRREGYEPGLLGLNAEKRGYNRAIDDVLALPFLSQEGEKK